MKIARNLLIAFHTLALLALMAACAWRYDELLAALLTPAGALIGWSLVTLHHYHPEDEEVQDDD